MSTDQGLFRKVVLCRPITSLYHEYIKKGSLIHIGIIVMNQDEQNIVLITFNIVVYGTIFSFLSICNMLCLQKVLYIAKVQL